MSSTAGSPPGSATIASAVDTATTGPVVRIRDASLVFGARTLWSGLDLDIAPGEFLTVLGGNGSGKTSLLRAILGVQQLTSGTVTVAGRPAGRGSRAIGYIQQQQRIDPLTPMRARDIVRQGIDGHRFGFGRPGRVPWPQVEQALDDVGALHLADRPVGLLSGGEQQRVRAAQALVTGPALLLADEPLLSLDLASQRTVTRVLDDYRRTHATAIVFVTHEINPVLPYTDRVLYLAGGRFRIGTVDTVMTSTTLSELYRTPVEVIRSQGQVFVAGTPSTPYDTHHPENDDDEEIHVA